MNGPARLLVAAGILHLVLVLPAAPMPLSQALLRLAPELPLILLALALARLRLPVALALLVLTVQKLADLATMLALGRGFNPLTDLPLVEITPGVSTVTAERRRMTLAELIAALGAQRREVFAYLEALDEADLRRKARIPLFEPLIGTDEITLHLINNGPTIYHESFHDSNTVFGDIFVVTTFVAVNGDVRVDYFIGRNLPTC